MTNCPNCGAPINVFSWRCEYCGTYVFDFSAWDVEDGKPCFVSFKTSQGKITALARPRLETIEISDESTDATDSYGNVLTSFRTNRICELNAKFICIAQPKTGNLFRVDK